MQQADPVSSELTVVIPSYKAVGTIERAVMSVLGQPGVQARVIVVIDDKSAETEDLLKAIGDPRISVFMNDRNRGAPYSRNFGLARTTTPYVMFLDSDDYLSGEVLASLVEALRGSDADVAFAPWIKLNEDTNACDRRLPEFRSPRHAFESWLIEQKSIPPCSVLWRSDFIRGIDGWDEDLKRVQDGELVLRALLRGARIATCRRGAGVYFQHAAEYRITAGSDYTPLLVVADKLLQVESSLFDEQEKRNLLARYLYRNAKKAFRLGDLPFGRAALERSRDLGLKGNDGSLLARAGATAFGVERYHRLMASFSKQ